MGALRWLGLAVVVACNGGKTAPGSDTSTTGPTTDTHTGPTGTGPYHPADWADPLVHGLSTKLQGGVDDQGGDCRDCHGSDLEGGSSGVACSSCHGAGWTTDCTFCHGDPADGTGAPPRDIDGQDQQDQLSFPQHRIHVDEGTLHADYDCTFCHEKPADALAMGHLFDDATAARAEVQFLGGSYNQGSQTCTQYCHGDGHGNNGSVSVSDGAVNCSSCHKSSPTTGHHTTHKFQGIDCNECHADVDANGTAITDPGLHVDGAPSVALPSGISFDSGSQSCDGSCHNENHSHRGW